MIKVNHKLCPYITDDTLIETTNNQFSQYNCPVFITPQIRSVFHGTKSISYLGPKIWDIVPEECKHKKSLNSFKEPIKMWVPTNCPCRLSKVCLDGVAFINRT